MVKKYANLIQVFLGERGQVSRETFYARWEQDRLEASGRSRGLRVWSWRRPRVEGGTSMGLGCQKGEIGLKRG
jgi:hypothetical protein